MRKSPRTYKSSSRKRFYKSKVTRPRVRGNLGKGFPKQITMTHKYSEDVVVTGTTGAIGKYFFCCNGMFDPNVTGTGHQPMYFDQMTALYNHYTVIGSKIRARFIPVAATNAGFAYGINLNDDTTMSATTYTDIAEQTQSKVKYSNPNNTNALFASAKWGVKKFFPGSTLANAELRGTSGTNPTESTFFCIYMEAADGASTISVQLLVDIEFIAVWTELKDIAAS